MSILTITLNPTIDVSTSAPSVVPGPKLRCAAPRIDAGGGGVNVSRAIAQLGGNSTAFVATGGATGSQLVTLLQLEQIDCIPFAAPGDTRQSMAVTALDTGAQYRFVLPGPQWDISDETRAIETLTHAAANCRYVVLSGSQPPGVALDFTARLTRALEASDADLIVDTSGAALRQLRFAPANPFLLRMDDAEAAELAARPLETRAETARFAADLVAKRVARHVIIARGADGSTLAGPNGTIHCIAADVPVVSKVGAGDSFVAGFALALSHGLPVEMALRHGTAAASAAVMTEATALCTQKDAERLLAECPLCAVTD